VFRIKGVTIPLCKSHVMSTLFKAVSACQYLKRLKTIRVILMAYNSVRIDSIELLNLLMASL
jgi:hypothetical protein